mgnify:CR=1 FL=1
MDIQAIVQAIIEWFQSVSGIVITCGVTVGGIGIALVKTLRPKTKHERALESAIISQQQLITAQKAEIETLKKDFAEYKQLVNERLSTIGMAVPNMKVRSMVRQWTEEDTKKAIELAKMAVAVAPTVIEVGKKVVGGIRKKA